MIVSVSSIVQQVPTPTTPVPGAPDPAVSVPETRFPSQATTVYLTGADGSVWNLTNGPVWLQPGVVGFTPPNIAHRWKTSPMLDGQVRAGYGLGAQRLVLPVFVDAPSSLEWRDLDDALWQALTPDAQCLVTVTAPDAETRSMPAWFTGVGDSTEMPQDPIAAGWSQYRLEFDAEEPFWQGTTTVQTLKPETPLPYYAPAGSAYVKALSAGQSAANATLRNPGDVAAWPVYAISGAVAGFTVGVGGSNITYGAVADGTTVWIDTHPARQTVGYSRGDNSETAWLGVTGRSFAAVPAGGEVPFTVTLATPGANAAVTVELTPRYRRPW